jgi:hypothetical protein
VQSGFAPGCCDAARPDMDMLTRVVTRWRHLDCGVAHLVVGEGGDPARSDRRPALPAIGRCSSNGFSESSQRCARSARPPRTDGRTRTAWWVLPRSRCGSPVGGTRRRASSAPRIPSTACFPDLFDDQRRLRPRRTNPAVAAIAIVVMMPGSGTASTRSAGGKSVRPNAPTTPASDFPVE